ncbi:aldehyde dehydrogenase family protein [Tunturiibacter empetritectus]|uniref:Aldehyde dehydrogenase (NAD+) n=2 Tax=Tunturiibacter TaxID=3154218 RepID=A0A852VK72_9BACT|nr:aldehyde dehydrogenase family protein [Edaphobacter lichenicola]NYF89916.1 aldehyde dehydrogenase (NAD+) [Edaphobacter lichenicola]
MDEAEEVNAIEFSLRREAQLTWANLPIQRRLDVLRRARFAMSRMADAFSDAIPSHLCRTPADTRVAEVLPLLAACRFLEQRAEKILEVQRLGSRRRPFWLAGLISEVQRVPYGVVLILGPANYPLFLPGVQTLQALAAGNAVMLKPGHGGGPIAKLFAEALYAANLPRSLLEVTDDSVEAAEEALRSSVDKVIFTGSAQTARTVLRVCAEKIIPCVIEASGCDAVVVLPSANLKRVVRAITFGMRLNGSATCMAPRRLLLLGASEDRKRTLVGMLSTAFNECRPVHLGETPRANLGEMFHEAERLGAHVHGSINTEQRPILVTEVKPGMRLAQADLFAPVLSMIDISSETEVLAAQKACPFALTASVFGDEAEAKRLASTLNVGNVLINDVIVATVDPRTPFGGRKESGYGTTRGTEGLLEMTTAKVVTVQRNKSVRHYEVTGDQHRELFDGVILASHSQTIHQRCQGLARAVGAAMRLRRK